MYVENGLLINRNNGSRFNATGEYQRETAISGTTGNHKAAWLISHTDSQGATSKFSVGFTATQNDISAYVFSNINFEYLSINGKYFRTSTLYDTTKMVLLRLFYL